MLHITNGDCAVEALSRGGVAADDILPWRDVLHEGPVPAGLTLDELSSVRAAFVAECGWGELDEVREDFRARDCRLAGAQAEEEVVLWFESDLYDQLQLIQLLDWFSDPTHRPGRLSCVYVDTDPGGRFQGLGGLQPERVARCFVQRTQVTQEQLDLGRSAWAAFRADRPTVLDDLRGRALQALPYLSDAIVRVLQELPAVEDGLSRSERAALEALAEQPCTRDQLFRAAQAREERPFMGDWTFWRLLDWLGSGPAPLVQPYALPAGVTTIRQSGGQEPKQALTITQTGRSVLRGEMDAVLTNGIHRWLGGTRLWRGDMVWRWDGARSGVAPG